MDICKGPQQHKMQYLELEVFWKNTNPQALGDHHYPVTSKESFPTGRFCVSQETLFTPPTEPDPDLLEIIHSSN